MVNFVPEPTPDCSVEYQSQPTAELIVFCRRELLLWGSENELYQLPQVAQFAQFPWGEMLKIGTRDGHDCYALELPEAPTNLPSEVQWVSTRLAVGLVSESVFVAASRGKELLHWRHQHKFCGQCGQLLTASTTDVALVCPNCHERYYPQLAPAVIVAITRGDQILLAHNRKFLPEVHGLIAGFVEAGENVEMAIAREIREETGIEVGNIRYFASQCWPFPNSLMLAFYADYRSGEAQADGTELETLGWFTGDALPKIPPPGSIARRLIDDFVAHHRN